MLYHLNQIQMAYNTNRIEGSRLTEEQTRYLYETRTVMCDALVDNAIGSLLAATPSKMTFEDICDFHYRFELIHPFQDGNGRVGRLVMFGQCLANGIMPFIVTDAEKAFYYRGLAGYDQTPGSCATHCGTFRTSTTTAMSATSRIQMVDRGRGDSGG